MAFLEGFGVGLAMIIFIGPVFFTLLKSTLQYGFKAGMAFSWGVFISDIVCVVLCAFGAIPFFKNADNQLWLAVVGSIILFGLGFKYVLKPNVSIDKNITIESQGYAKFFTKGFLINFVNPFVFLVWIGVIGYGMKQYGSSFDLVVFLGAACLAVLVTDSLKVIFANRIKDFIQPQYLLWTYRVIGIVLIGFGVRMVIFVW